MHAKSTSVLVATSSEPVRAALTKLLKRYGATIESADSGLDCIDKLRRLMPELLLLDQQLLWGGAEGVLARIREDHSIPWTDVLLVADQVEAEERWSAPPIIGCKNKARLVCVADRLEPKD